MRFLKGIAIWFLSVIIIMTIFTGIVGALGLGENDYLIIYRIIVLVVPIALAVTLSKKEWMGKRWMAEMPLTIQPVNSDIEVNFKDFRPICPMFKNGETAKECAEKLLTNARLCADELNTSTTVEDFSTRLIEMKGLLQNLAYINENLGLSMSPTPRANFTEICSNMRNTIRDFIDRATEACKVSSDGTGTAISLLISEMNQNIIFRAFMTPQHQQQLERIVFNSPVLAIGRSNNPLSSIEYIERYFEEKYLYAFNHFLSLSESMELYEKTVKEFEGIELPLMAQVRFEQLQAEYKEKFSNPNPLIDVDQMDGPTFEVWCAELLKKNGFIDVTVTPTSGDQGVDIIAVKDEIRYAIQCKRYSSDLGNTPVQEVSAGKMLYHCQVGAVMTNQHFTAGAKDLAAATGTLLWDRDKLSEMLKLRT